MSNSGNTIQSKYISRYLRITIHDNDFTNSLEHVANTLNAVFKSEGRYPEEDELPLLKKYVQSLWFSIDNISDILRWNKTSVKFKENSEKIYEPELKFVDYLDIPEWDNYESVYIPMFDNAEILIR